jgi:superkiller protein 3
LAESHSGLGGVLGKIGQLEEAEARCRRAIELKPKGALAHSNLGAILARQGRIDEAIACFRKAIELDPAFAPAHHNLGKDLVRKGKLAEAILSYRKAIDLGKNQYALGKNQYANAHVDLGTALTRQGKAEEAIACYRKALDLEPNNSYALRNLGTVLAGQGKTQEALACYSKAITLDPKDATAFNGRAWNLATCADLGLRNPAEAVRCAEASTRLAPKNGGNWNTLGVARYRAGEHTAAVAALTRSMELTGGGTAFDWFFLAMAQHRLGKKEEARKWYEGAVQWMEKNQPQDEELRRFRAEAEGVLGIKKDGK